MKDAIQNENMVTTINIWDSVLSFKTTEKNNTTTLIRGRNCPKVLSILNLRSV